MGVEGSSSNSTCGGSRRRRSATTASWARSSICSPSTPTSAAACRCGCPKGTVIRDELEKWARETERRWGYQRVVTPHIARGELFRISGHLPYYQDVDIHSHSDYTLLADPRAMSAIFQGVTLEVVGNCGFGCAPIGIAAKDGISIDGSVPLEWRDFAGYFAALNSRRPAINVMSLVPNGQLRRTALGKLEGPAGQPDLEKMGDLLDQSLDEGCCGYSTGLEYPVERGAPEEEIAVLVRRTAARGGFYATHTRDRGIGALPPSVKPSERHLKRGRVYRYPTSYRDEPRKGRLNVRSISSRKRERRTSKSPSTCIPVLLARPC